MNIMLVTVTERTKEIGIRKAVGAKDKDILKQFLIESIVMTGLGGIIGISLGVGIATIIGYVTPFKPFISLTAILLALSFSMSVGIFFGFYPAHRASKLNTIEALHYE